MWGCRAQTAGKEKQNSYGSVLVPTQFSVSIGGIKPENSSAGQHEGV